MLTDLDQLIEISKHTFAEAFEKANDPKDFNAYMLSAFSKETIKKQLLNPDSDFYFVFLNTNLVAYFKLNQKSAQTENFDNSAAELERIYVLPKYIGKGLGELILNEIILITKSNKSSCLWLGVWEKNSSAIRFYARHGFEKFGTHPYFMGNDKQTDWLMKKALL